MFLARGDSFTEEVNFDDGFFFSVCSRWYIPTGTWQVLDQNNCLSFLKPGNNPHRRS